MFNTIILASSFLALFFLAELLFRRGGIHAEHTRKIVHFGTGILTLLFPLMLDNHWLVLLLCASFALILLVSLKYHLLPSINAIERKSHGSLSYPIAVYICYLVFDHMGSGPEDHSKQYVYFYLPVLILAICDPVAALSGRKWPIYPYTVGKDKKTLMGSAMFFLSSFIVTLILLINFENATFSSACITAIVIGLATAITEGISPKGLDNLSIPFCTLIILLLTLHS